MKFLQIHTFYPQYLDGLYARFKHLAQASFAEQMDIIVADAFSGVHMIAPFMYHRGYEGRLVVANCAQAQTRWLDEQGLQRPTGPDWVEEVVLRQVEDFEPDILYLSEPVTFNGQFLRKLTRKPRLVLGWRAAAFPADIDWSGFDVMLSSLSPLLKLAVRQGAKAGEIFFPGFPGKVAERIEQIKPSVDVVFTGQYTRLQHAKRGFYLREITRHAAGKGYSCALHLSGENGKLPDHLKPYVRPPVYAMAMHQALRSGRIAFDSRADHFVVDPASGRKVDLGGKETANMRIIEATGSGVFLLTEHFDNIGQFFEIGKEIETFTDRKELLEKLSYYVEHPREREEIAARGQERCLRDHSIERRVEWLDEIIKKHLARKATEGESGDEPKTAMTGAGRSSGAVLKGNLPEILQYLQANHSKFPRRVPGRIKIDGKLLHYADMHSFYHELAQIFGTDLYGFDAESRSPVILDCGAHVGLASIYFALRHPRAEIHAFEADPDIFSFYERNIRSMGLGSIKRHNKAVWVHGDGVAFAKSGDDSGHIDEQARGEEVPSVRLRDVLAGLERVDMLKMDVEGAEFEVMRDCAPVLDRVRRLIIETHLLKGGAGGHTLASLLDTIEKAGFNYVISDLHPATWLSVGQTPPFSFIKHDKYICTLFCWR